MSKKITVDPDLFECVVKIYAVKSQPDFGEPWKIYPPYQSYSTGFVIDNKRILCTAHGAVYSSSLLVSKHGNPKKYNAKATHICNDVDLAILTVDSQEFWDKIASNRKYKMLELYDFIPRLQNTVYVLGYPLGGRNLCITKGVISRVNHSPYTHSGLSNLIIQTDAPINGGASGGPAIMNNKVVGMAFQSYNSRVAQNAGYCVPVPVMKWFLNGIEKFNGNVPRIPFAGFNSQKCENEAMQRKLKMIINKNKEKTEAEIAAQIAKRKRSSLIINESKSMDISDTDIDKILATESSSESTPEMKPKNGDDNKDTPKDKDKNKDNDKDSSIGTDKNGIKNTQTKTKTKNTQTQNESKQEKKENNDNEDETEKQGVFINRLCPLTPAQKVLKIGDVLLSINDIAIANDGTVPFRFSERIPYNYLLTKYYSSDSVVLKILRNGSIIEINLQLCSPNDCILVAWNGYDIPKECMTYFIFGGLVFVPLSKFYLNDTFGQNNWVKHAPSELKNLYYNSIKEYESQEIVILSHILPHNVNHSYEISINDCCVVKKCNDIDIKNVKHLVTIVDGLDENKESDQFVKFEVSPYNVVILELKEAKQALDEILLQNNIRADRSDNLKVKEIIKEIETENDKEQEQEQQTKEEEKVKKKEEQAT